MKAKQKYLYNALLLTAVTLLMRTVTVSFNVYVSNRAGAEAMGLLALISGVYGFAVTVATSGIQLATVRTVAERLERTEGAENKKCVLSCIGYATFFGSIATLLLFFLARPIGHLLLRDARTVRALRTLSFTLLPIAISAVLNGYFTAVRRAWKNAVTQVTEQGVKIALTTYFLLVVAPKTVEGSLLAILLGGAVAESLSLLLNLVLYQLDKRHFRHVKIATPSLSTGKKVGVTAIALPVAISAYMRSGLLAIEHILIPRGLSRYGSGNTAALAAYGSLQSMALPVILYPAAILSSFSSLLIPEMTEQQAAGNKREIRYIAGRVYQMTLLFSIGVGGVMFFLSGELGQVLYHSDEVGIFIRRLAPLIPIMYLDTATDGMLKGLGQQVYSMNVNIIDALISVIAVAVLVPHMGISGYILTIYITEIFNAACSVARLLRITGFRPRLTLLFLRPLLSVIGATCTVNILLHFLPIGRYSGGALIGHILLTALFYLAFLLFTGGLGRADINWLHHSLLPKKRKRPPSIPSSRAAV
ncbi:MAG: hypothetical protein E7590_06050 [Ruminococcaceae bacterium]|nr:hypothetical protein [Oscillospiraceae bacterium]